MTRNRVADDSTAQRKPIAWQHFADAVANGFQPPTGRGRCRDCAFHLKTQGHRAGCPKASAPPASTQKQPYARRSKQEPTQ